MYAGFVAGLVPTWMPKQLFWAYFVGAAFFAAAVGIVIPMLARPAATMLGIMFFIFVLLLHIPRISLHSRDGNEWTSGFVALAMCGGAWILASASPLLERETADPFLKLGRYFFALAFVAFGIEHFVYAQLAAGLGPPWYTGDPAWAYLAGVVFVVNGAAIFLKKRAHFAATLLGVILFLFFLLFYVPRIVAQLRNPGPWTSAFEVLALGGASLVLASTSPSEKKE
jgi:uncharacterized membrane protein